MSQCVPDWELDDPPNPTSQGLALETSAVVAGAAQSRSDYEVATELTWVNGHLSMHGLEQLRIGKSDSKTPGSWDNKTLINSGGTLESLVDQATGAILFPTCHESPTTNFEVVPNWSTSNTTRPNCTTNATSAMMDALVPCANNQMLVPENIVGRKRMRDVNRSLSIGSAASMGLTFDVDGDVGFTTSTSPFDCTDNMSSGRPMTIVDEHDSACHSHRSRREDGYVVEENKKGEVTRSISTKRSRAAAVHNQSERKRRDKINQRMKTLQKLVPNSSKTDKASMLDEVIDYLKQLQAQVQMMNILSSTMPQMFMPMQQIQQMQMSMMAQMGMPMPMPMPMALDMTSQNHPPARSSCRLPPQPPMHAPTFNPFAMPAWNGGRDGMPPMASSTSIPIDPFSAFNMPWQAQKPMSMDALNRMAANMSQQMYRQTTNQNPTSDPK